MFCELLLSINSNNQKLIQILVLSEKIINRPIVLFLLITYSLGSSEIINRHRIIVLDHF